ncbi:hypothetical protein B0J14DRAFT_482231, partial [Halenospora varia]
LIQSRSFKFIVGGGEDGALTEFVVHEEAIAQLSPRLRSLMQGGLHESQTACAVWEDVSKETFKRFAQFAYTGDYSIPEGEKRLRKKKGGKGSKKGKKGTKSFGETNGSLGEASELQEIIEPPPSGEVISPTSAGFTSLGVFAEEPQMAEDDFLSSLKQREKYPEFAHVKLAANFNDINFVDALAPRDNYATTTEPSTSFNPKLNYSPILLAHTALYFLADYHQVDSLKHLSLYKLHKTLRTFIIDDMNIPDVIDLAKFAYHKHEGYVGHELRNVICQFMAVNALVLTFDEEFMELLGEGGQFVKDFIRFEVQRER